MQFGIEVLFQREYVYFPTMGNYVHTRLISPSNVVDINSIDNPISTKIEKADIVVPLPYVLSMHSYRFADSDIYYLTDVVNTVTLFNEQHLNEGETGYNAIIDKGKFIVQQDSEYNAKIYKKNGDAVLDALEVVLRAGYKKGESALIGLVPGLSETLEVLDFLEDIYSATLDEKKPINKEFYFDPAYVTAEGQIGETGKLSRTAISKLEMDFESGEYDEGSYLYYDIDDKFTNNYLLGYTPVPNEGGDDFMPAWETRVMRGFTLEFKSVNDSNYSRRAGDVHDFKILEENNREHNDLESTQTVHLLPGGENLFKFTPKYSGNYSLKTSSAFDEVNIFEINSSGTEVISNLDQFNKSMSVDLIGGVEYIFIAKFKNERDYVNII